ncbi:hypothetical protein B0H65DRAFT_187030 [Neurospora tetraspora]|uniref:Uncharacterized protein n=1 Tax=Neurospora tetraspora TaxID=94610 RepID=A0AAE0JF44_9PEZI|nr:hypothetical protein B0H65DRAFT_187030 [Neurospora tetraspora]
MLLIHSSDLLVLPSRQTETLEVICQKKQDERRDVWYNTVIHPLSSSTQATPKRQETERQTQTNNQPLLALKVLLWAPHIDLIPSRLSTENSIRSNPVPNPGPSVIISFFLRLHPPAHLSECSVLCTFSSLPIATLPASFCLWRPHPFACVETYTCPLSPLPASGPPFFVERSPLVALFDCATVLCSWCLFHPDSLCLNV